MSKILFAITIFFLLCGFSCEKEGAVPEVDNTVEAQFIFIKKEPFLKSVILRSYLYNIDTDSTNIYTVSYNNFTENFYPQGNQDSAFYLNDTTMHLSKKVGLGSRRKFEIKIRVYQENLKDYTYYEYWSNDLQFGDTISEKEQAVEKFVWPEDTARYILIETGEYSLR